MNKIIGIFISILAIIGIFGAVFVINDVFDLSGKTIEEENAEIAEYNEKYGVDEETANQTKNAYDNIKKIKNETDDI